jgi:hypothetical protein
VLLFLLGYWLRDRTTGAGNASLFAALALGGPIVGDGLGGAEEHIRRPSCWQIKHCPPGRRLNCPAYTRSYLPCWMAVQLACGEVKHECHNCALYDLRKAA